MDAALQLAKKLYAEQENRIHPAWEDLQHEGACQKLWYARAEQQILNTHNDFVEAGRSS